METLFIDILYRIKKCVKVYNLVCYLSVEFENVYLLLEVCVKMLSDISGKVVVV